MLELKRTDGSLIARTRHKSVRRQVEAHKAILCGADLYDADLYDADLHGADLHGANLHAADLRWADLRGADLCRANLHAADLRWADLRGADLCRANLTRANLTRANLTRADLFGANLYGADLCRAVLSGDPSAKWLSKWRGVSLLPVCDDGGVLVWKHVQLAQKRIMGNLGFEYAIGEPFECACMACAGPWGAVREVSEHKQAAHWAEMASNPEPYVLAVHVAPGALYDYAPQNGIYYALAGTPVALYRVTNVDADGFDRELVSGTDVFGMIEAEEG